MQRRQVLVGGFAAAFLSAGGAGRAELGVVAPAAESLPSERRRMVDALVVQFTEKPGTERDASVASLAVCKGCLAAARSVAPWFEHALWMHYGTHPRQVAALYADPSGFDTHAKVMGIYRQLPDNEVAALLFIWDTDRLHFPRKGEAVAYPAGVDLGDTFFLAARVGGNPRTGPVTLNPVREIQAHDDASRLA